MPGCRPLERSKSRKLIENDWDHEELETQNMEKSEAYPPSGRQRIDVKALGLTLGSLRDSPLPPLPREDESHSNEFPFPTSTNGRPGADTDDSMASLKDNKTKGSRWKAFGGIFGKRDATARMEGQNLRSPDQTAQQAIRTVPNQLGSTTRKRAGSDKEKGMDFHNLVVKKQAARRPSILRRVSTKRKYKRKWSASEARTDVSRTQLVPEANATGQSPLDSIRRRRRQNDNSQSQGSFSLLKVEIPTVELERYSIMFGSVLKPGLSSRSQISLVGSSQASIGVTKPSVPHLRAPPSFDELPKPHRREGSLSSSCSKSPSFSLFPSRQSSPTRAVINKPLPKPSPLSRSVTAPEIPKTSPPRPPLKANKSQDITHLLAAAPGKENIPISKFAAHSRQSSFQSSHARKPSFDLSREPATSNGVDPKLSWDNSLYSFTSCGRKPSFDPSLPSTSGSQASVSDEALENSSKAPSSYAQPIRTTTASSNTKQAFLNRAFPTRKSSLKRPNQSNISSYAAEKSSSPLSTLNIPDLELPNPPYGSTSHVPHTSTESVNSAAEISIARQISISRRQKQLLIPVVKQTARQPLTPQVANARGVDGGGRKSEVVMLEQA